VGDASAWRYPERHWGMLSGLLLTVSTNIEGGQARNLPMASSTGVALRQILDGDRRFLISSRNVYELLALRFGQHSLSFVPKPRSLQPVPLGGSPATASVGRCEPR
jgi:hypothetical protein